MTGLATSCRKNPLRHGHAADVFRTGLPTHQDHFLAALGPLFRPLRREDNFADRSSGNRIYTGRQDFRRQGLPVHYDIDHRIEEALNVFRLDAEDSFFLGDKFLVGHVDRDAERGGGRAFAGACLQHVELPVLDSELHILHVAIVLLKLYSNFLELPINLGHGLLHFAQRHGSSNASDNVFALSVHQVIAIEDFLAGTRVARKADARAGSIAGIPEDHLHDVDGRTEETGDFLHAPVRDCLLRHPGAEDRADCSPQLVDRIVREILP